jgi:hypothetical protein
MLLFIVAFTAPSTPPMLSQHLFSQLTPTTPPTRELHNKQPRFNSPRTPQSHIRIMTHATPPSSHIRQLITREDDSEMDDIQPMRFFGGQIQNADLNIGDDVFGGHPNLAAAPSEIPINVDAGLQNHDPAWIIQGVHHTFHSN